MGSGPLMGWMSPAPWTHLLLVLCLQSVVMAYLDCTYNSWTLMSCSWAADSNFTSSPCYITTNVPDEKRDIKGFCTLPPESNPRNCTMKLTADLQPVNEILSGDRTLTMSVICSDDIRRNTSVKFLYEVSAYHNLLLDPPASTDIEMISYGVWNLTWDIRPSSDIKSIEAEIQYKPVDKLWQDALNIRIGYFNITKNVILKNLRPDTHYEARVRVNQTDFPRGRWSDWGTPVQWTTAQGLLDCTYNSFEMVSCSWRTDKTFLSSPCYLSANVNNISRRIKGICYLLSIGDQRSCSMNITVNGRHFRNAMTAAHHMSVRVICSVGNMNMTITSLSGFYPFNNLRLDPPAFLYIKMIEDGVWNLSWVNNHRNYIDNVETEVQFKLEKWSWKDAKRFTIKQYDLSVLLRDLHPDTMYEARVRINQTDFQGGRWSEWTKPLQWTTPPKGATFSTPGVVAASVVLLILVVTLCSSKRVKKIMWIGVPDPSHFFHPLIDTHKGNFKKWLATPYVFSPFFEDPSPLDISPLNINSKMEEQQVKCPAPPGEEADKERQGHSGCSFTNKEYFSSVYFGYDHFPAVINESLHSPTDEDLPLFRADYLCAPQSIAGFGVYNSSFEQDSPQVVPLPVLIEEVISEANCEDEDGDIPPQEPENDREDNEEENSEDHTESLETVPTSMVQQHGSKPSNEADTTADYLSLKELYQKHGQWV